MTQTEKDALIRAEKEGYKKICSNLYDQQQRVSNEYKSKLTDISNLMLKQKAEHNKRMEAIMAIEAERNPANGVSGDEKRKLHHIRAIMQQQLEKQYGEGVSVQFKTDEKSVNFTIDLPTV